MSLLTAKNMKVVAEGGDGYAVVDGLSSAFFTYYYMTQTSAGRMALEARGEGGWFDTGVVLRRNVPVLVRGLGPLKGMRLICTNTGGAGLAVVWAGTGAVPSFPGQDGASAAAISDVFDGDEAYTSEPLVMDGRTNLAFTAVAAGVTIAGTLHFEGDHFNDAWAPIPVSGSPATLAVVAEGTVTDVLSPVPYLRTRFRWVPTGGNSVDSTITGAMSAA